MKFSLYLLPVLSLIAIACNKDDITTTPQVKIKSVSPEEVRSGNILSIKGSYTDQEGDIDTIIIVYKWYAGTTATLIDTLPKIAFETLKVPPKTKEADIELDYEYNTINTDFAKLSGVSKDTTATLGLILKDKAGNRSNYAESTPFRLLKP